MTFLPPREAELKRELRILQEKHDYAHHQWMKADKEMVERGHKIGELERELKAHQEALKIALRHLFESARSECYVMCSCDDQAKDCLREQP